MPRYAFLKEKPLLDRFKDDYKRPDYLRSAHVKKQWENPIIRRKRVKGIRSWVNSFMGRNHIHRLARLNAVHQASFKESFMGFPNITEGKEMDKRSKVCRDNADWVVDQIKELTEGLPVSIKELSVNTDPDDYYVKYEMNINGKSYEFYSGDDDFTIVDPETHHEVRGGLSLTYAGNLDLIRFCDKLTGGTDEAKEPADEKLGYEKGHKNSKGEDAPWVIRSHVDNRVLASFATKKAAEEHMQRMKQYSKEESKKTEAEAKEVTEDEGKEALRKLSKRGELHYGNNMRTDGLSLSQIADEIRYDVATAMDMEAEACEDAMLDYGYDRIYVAIADGKTPAEVAADIKGSKQTESADDDLRSRMEKVGSELLEKGDLHAWEYDFIKERLAFGEYKRLEKYLISKGWYYPPSEAYVDNSDTAKKDYVTRVVSALQDYYEYNYFKADDMVHRNYKKVMDWYMSGKVDAVEAARCLGGNCEPTMESARNEADYGNSRVSKSVADAYEILDKHLCDDSGKLNAIDRLMITYKNERDLYDRSKSKQVKSRSLAWETLLREIKAILEWDDETPHATSLTSEQVKNWFKLKGQDFKEELKPFVDAIDAYRNKTESNEPKNETRNYFGYAPTDILPPLDDKEQADFVFQVIYEWLQEHLPETLKDSADNYVMDVIDMNTHDYEQVKTMDDFYAFLDKYGPAVVDKATRSQDESKSVEGLALELLDTIRIPQWLWVAYQTDDITGLEDDELDKLQDFKEKYKDCHLDDRGDEAYFSSRNDFDNLGGNVYDVDVYKISDMPNEKKSERQGYAPYYFCRSKDSGVEYGILVDADSIHYLPCYDDTGAKDKLAYSTIATSFEPIDNPETSKIYDIVQNKDSRNIIPVTMSEFDDFADNYDGHSRQIWFKNILHNRKLIEQKSEALKDFPEDTNYKFTFGFYNPKTANIAKVAAEKKGYVAKPGFDNSVSIWTKEPQDAIRFADAVVNLANEDERVKLERSDVDKAFALAVTNKGYSENKETIDNTAAEYAVVVHLFESFDGFGAMGELTDVVDFLEAVK